MKNEILAKSSWVGGEKKFKKKKRKIVITTRKDANAQKTILNLLVNGGENLRQI